MGNVNQLKNHQKGGFFIQRKVKTYNQITAYKQHKIRKKEILRHKLTK